MKTRFYFQIFGVVMIAGLLAACSAASPETDKKAQLEKLKSQQSKLSLPQNLVFV